MKRRIKEYAIVAHFVVCLLMLSAEHAENVSLRYMLAYYLFAIGNMALSVTLINKFMRKHYGQSTPTPNRDRIS